MSNSRGRRARRPLTYVIAATLAAASLCNAVWAVLGAPRGSAGTCLVRVTGNVGAPGTYRVPRGSSRYEILKVAGVNLRSDIAALDLAGQIDGNSSIDVGTLDKPVSLKQEPARVGTEFYFGEVTVIAADGKSRPVREGMAIAGGDRVLTEAHSQVELSVNAYSRIDLDGFSELTFDKIGKLENGKSLVEMFQQSGSCWYKMAYADRADLYRVVTPVATVTVAGSGADFLVEVAFEQATVHCFDGMLLVERPSGEESVNLIAGQTAAVFGDGRPVQVRSLAPDVSPNDRFAQLVKTKTDFMLSQMPLNFLVFGVPGTCYLVSLQYDRGMAKVVHVPGETYVGQFVQGVSTLDQAVLQGGPVLASTIMERIADTKIPRYFLVRKDEAIRVAASVGEISVAVDPAAAAALGVRSGQQRLTGEQLVKFMKPTISGADDALRRQGIVLKSLFDAVHSKAVILSAILAEQLVSGAETNFGASDVLKEYAKFTANKQWSYSTRSLPVSVTVIGGRTLYDPALDQCRKILQED